MLKFWETFSKAAGPHWFRTALVIGGVPYTLVSFADGWAQAHGFDAIFPTWPKVAYSAAAIAVLLVVWFWKYAHQLRMVAEPKVVLSFEANSVGITEAIAQATGGAEIATRFVRFRVDADSDTNVGCSAAIVGFALRAPGDSDYKPLELPQILEFKPQWFEVRAGMPHRIDFLKSDGLHNLLYPTTNLEWPNIWKRVFEHPHSFRYDFAVNDGRKTKVLRVEIDWNGQWNEIVGRQVSVT